MSHLAPVSYTPPGWLFKHAELHKVLDERLHWIRHDNAPRDEYYVARDGRDYAYKAYGGMRTYHSQPLHPVIQTIWDAVERRVDTRFDAVFLNRYADGSDHLGWHSDDGETMDDSRPIAIVSLGAIREIWFRPVKVETADVEKIVLQSGSLTLMARGMQDTHQHRIPKASYAQAGSRISLTFRGLTP